jgi:alkanesulfonate monooxygenase
VTTLSYIAARTTKVKLGVAVLVLPLRNPVVLAKQLANLDLLSEGRLIVGVAPGAPNITRPEFDAIGVPYEERGKITDEYISVLKKIWNESLPSFSGKYSSFKEVQVFPKPVQKDLKVLVGGGERGISPRALRRVVELGDGWIPAYLTPEEVAEGIAKIREAAARRGRDPAQFVVSHEMFAVIDADGDAAKSGAAKSLATNFVSVEEGEKRSLVGHPSQLLEKIGLFSKAGVDMTELKFIYSDISSLLKMMNLFAKEILPSA